MQVTKENINIKEKIDRLIDKFSEVDWTHREGIAEELCAIGESAIAHLQNRLENPKPTDNKDTKYWVIEVLGKIGGKSVISPLLKLVTSSYEERKKKYKHDVQFISQYKIYALRALKEIHSEIVIEPVVKSFAINPWHVNKVAAELLISFGERSIFPLIKEIENFQNKDYLHWPIKVLGILKVRQAIPIFMKMLLNKKFSLKYEVIQAIGEINYVDEQLIETLKNMLLSTKDWFMRKAIINAFGKLKVVEAADVIIQFLNDEELVVQSTAADALVNIGMCKESKDNLTCKNMLLEYLEKTDKTYRYYIPLIIAKIQDKDLTKQLIPILLKYFKIENNSMEIASNYKTHVSEIYAIIQAFGTTKLVETVPHLINIYHKIDNTFLKKTIVESLGKIGTDEAIKFIKSLSKNEPWHIREAIKYALKVQWLRDTEKSDKFD